MATPPAGYAFAIAHNTEADPTIYWQGEVVKDASTQEWTSRLTGVDLVDVLLRPTHHDEHRRQEPGPERGELVVDGGPAVAIDGASHQAVAFQAAQGLGEHLATGAGDRTGEIAVPPRPARNSFSVRLSPIAFGLAIGT